MAKKILKLEQIIEYDFLLLALICSDKDFRLCFALNDHLKLKLKRVQDFEILNKQKSKNVFSTYYCLNSDNERYWIINNKGRLGPFIPELKTIDFFMLVKNLSHKKKVDDLISNLKKINVINGVYEMDPYAIKSAENFLIAE